MEPQLVIGSCTPKPKKLRKDSYIIMPGTSSEAYTITTPSTLGMMWRMTILRRERPLTRAASTNSLCFRLKVWPRTIRATSSHDTKPTAAKIRMRLRPKKVVSRMTKNMNGKELRISRKRIISESILPPKKPASAP